VERFRVIKKLIQSNPTHTVTFMRLTYFHFLRIDLNFKIQLDPMGLLTILNTVDISVSQEFDLRWCGAKLFFNFSN